MACKDCKHCEKKGLLVYPLRYGVAVAGPRLNEAATEAARQLDPKAAAVLEPTAALDELPALAGKLGRGVADLKLGATARYTVRLLREGFLYMLTERAGILRWQGYAVLESTQLYEFDIESPPSELPPMLCSRDGTLMHSYLVGIENPQDVPNAWFLFSPVVLTPEILKAYRKDPAALAAAGKLQHFSPADWMAESIEQPHTLLAVELKKYVLDHRLYSQHSAARYSLLGIAARMQLFPPPGSAYEGQPPDDKGEHAGTLGRIYKTLRRNGGACIALHDHIGITQELNDFRNAALLPVEEFLARHEGEANNERRLEVMQAIEDVRKGYASRLITRELQKIQPIEEANRGRDKQGWVIKELRAQGRHAEADKVEADIRAEKERKARDREKLLAGEDAAQEWNRLYGKHLDQKEIEAFRGRLETISEHCGQQANSRAPDHLAWVKSGRLVDAFDMFDPADQVSGFEFAREHMHCTYGMFGVAQNRPTLVEWMDIDKIERSNLYMRANLYNHQDLIAQVSAGFAEIRKETRSAGSVEHVAQDKLAKIAKGVVDAFKKSDSAWDEWLRDEVIIEWQQGTATAEGSKFSKNLAKLKTEAERRVYRSRMGRLSKFQNNCVNMRLARIGEWTRAISSLRGGKVDSVIASGVGLLMYGQLRGLTEKIGMQEFLLKLSDEKLAAIKRWNQGFVEKGWMRPEVAEKSNQQHQTEAARKARESAARPEAAEKAKVEAAKVNGKSGPLTLEELIRDEQRKLGGRLRLTQEELSKGERPASNNFHQTRLGLLLISLESMALMLKLTQHEGEWSDRGKWEIAGSVLSLLSMGCDLVYASAKSLREMNDAAEAVNKVVGFSKAADIYRGGFKITAGALSTVAGAISVGLDVELLWGERDKERSDWVLIGVYTAKVLVGGTSSVIGFIAAFSYTGPMLRYVASARWATALRVARFASMAEGVAVSRTLWLLRLARFNWIGLALTAVELGYTLWIKDDELEVWCKSCVFRMKKDTTGFFSKKPYTNTKQELEALEQAFRLVVGQSGGASSDAVPLAQEPAYK